MVQRHRHLKVSVTNWLTNGLAVEGSRDVYASKNIIFNGVEM